MFNKEKIIEYILSLILPKDEKILEIENMSEENIFQKIPKSECLKNQKIKSIFKYKNEITKTVIWEIKYKKNKKIIKKFSKILYEFILEEFSNEMIFSNFKNPLLIPVPMSKNDFKKRGFNQSELMVMEIKKLDINNLFEFTPDLILKTKDTTHQSKLKNKEERLKNLNGCFSINNNIINNRNIIIIDDVVTTGATMSEIFKILKEAGAKKIIGFSLAH